MACARIQNTFIDFFDNDASLTSESMGRVKSCPDEPLHHPFEQYPATSAQSFCTKTPDGSPSRELLCTAERQSTPLLGSETCGSSPRASVHSAVRSVYFEATSSEASGALSPRQDDFDSEDSITTSCGSSPSPVSQSATSSVIAGVPSSEEFVEMLPRPGGCDPHDGLQDLRLAGTRLGLIPSTDVSAPRPASIQEDLQTVKAVSVNDCTWLYLDSHGKYQGPFSGKQMHYWLVRHKLPSNLFVKCECYMDAFQPIYAIFPDPAQAFLSLQIGDVCMESWERSIGLSRSYYPRRLV